MKVEEQQRAKELRLQGLSIKTIAKHLNVSSSSVSLWVRDVKLTSNQIAHLKNREYIKGANSNKEKWRRLRNAWQLEGRKMAKDPSALFITGCMLYWAEGRKSRSALALVNSDPALLKVFLNFLLKEMQVEQQNIRLQINCYTDLHSQTEIETYWLDQLQLQRNSLLKTMVNAYPTSSKKKRRQKLEYGTCSIRVSSTQVLQKIYGAIQEISGFDNPTWVDAS
ncbi:hypothetical protein C4588_04755 [Candidatus Parcubacteria bacterium]|nr:MAG: hypothetical protein C4588_04755 [Candidatus Parcubacteria bacterium]